MESSGGTKNSLHVSRETLQRLKAFSSELQKWSSAINLTAKISPDAMWQRHILDSLQLDQIPDRDARRWCDLGSGGGLPGLVLAISGKETRPHCSFCLIESDARKAAFLQMQCRAFDLNAVVLAQRIESAQPQCSDVVTARALAPLPKLLSYALLHQGPKSTILLPKGRNYQVELDAAAKDFTYDCEIRQSATDPEGVILVMRNLQRIEAQT